MFINLQKIIIYFCERVIIMNIFKKGLGLLKGKKSDAKKLGDAFSAIAEKVGKKGCETPGKLYIELLKCKTIKNYYSKNNKFLKNFSIAGIAITAFMDALYCMPSRPHSNEKINSGEYEELCSKFLVKPNNVNSQAMVKAFKAVDNGKVNGIEDEDIKRLVSNYFKKNDEPYDEDDTEVNDKNRATLVRSVLTYKEACDGIVELLKAIEVKWLADKNSREKVLRRTKSMSDLTEGTKLKDETKFDDKDLQKKGLKRTRSTSNLTELSKLNDGLEIDFNKLFEESGKSPLTQDGNDNPYVVPSVNGADNPYVVPSVNGDKNLVVPSVHGVEELVVPSVHGDEKPVTPSEGSDEKPVTPSEHDDKLPEKSSTSKKSKGERKIISKFNNIFKRTKKGSDKSKHDSDSSEKISEKSKKRYDNSSVQPGQAVRAGQKEFGEIYKSVQNSLNTKRSKSKGKQVDDNSTDSSK